MDVLTRGQLLRRLGGRRALARALSSGTWQRVLRGAYAPGDAPVDLALRGRAALLLVPARSLVADRCLLWLLGIDVLSAVPPALEVVVPRGAPVPRRHHVRARTTDLPRSDRALLQTSVLDRVPVLRPARAVADLLRALPLTEAVVVGDAVQRAGLLTRDDVATELDAHRGLRGVREARRALLLTDARAESPPESRVRVLLVLAGMHPVPQHEVRDARGCFIARVDLAVPSAQVAVEYDGREVHQRSDVFVHDRRRQNALLAAGWTVLRYTAQDLRERPDAVVAEVLAAVRRAA